MIILFAPIRAPAAAGIDPLHFGVVTPPLGVSLFAAERIAECGLGKLIRELLPFIAVALIASVSQTLLFLPRLAGF